MTVDPVGVLDMSTLVLIDRIGCGLVTERNRSATPAPSAQTGTPPNARRVTAYASCMASPAAIGYSVDDLDWLRDELGIAHIELDPWGSLIVTPATDEHEAAVAILNEQAVRQLALPPGSVTRKTEAWQREHAPRRRPGWRSPSPAAAAGG